MNIVYFIGNGFDLAQGLKTSYQDFYQYLKTQTPVNSVGALMLDHIKGPEIELWKDMELKLGEFTNEVPDKEQFEEFYFDLCEKLRGYLITQADSFTYSKEIKEKYARDIVAPYAYLSERDQIAYRSFFYSFGGERVVNVVSFNYTDVFDKAIYGNDSKVELVSYTNNYLLRPTIYIHGRLNTPYLLMGVNDETQIKNPAFASDEDVRDYLVKPTSNFEIGSMIDAKVERVISESHLIVLMGLSFGETDMKWWREIGTRIKNEQSVRVLIFSYVNALSEDPRRNQPKSREIRRDFLTKCGITEFGEYENKVFVILNGGMFSPNTHFYNDDRKGL